MKKLNIYYLLVAAFFIFGSCKKGEKGDTGPTGSQGIQGTNGINGTNGIDGVNANSSVISLTLNVALNGWHHYPTATNENDSAFLTVPEITQSIVDSGMVMVYRKIGNTYGALPLTYFYGAGVISYQYFYRAGKLNINYSTSWITTLQPEALTLKVIIASAHLRLANPNADWQNYESTSSLFNLSD